MPNKTIYVAESDLPVYARAQELTGDNLSATIVAALRRLVEFEEAKQTGFAEVTVDVGSGDARRRQRFLGAPLGEWNVSDKNHVEHFRVWRTPKGKFALHVERSKEHLWTAGADGSLSGWRKHFSSDQQWGEVPATATLEVCDSLTELEPKVPAGLYTVVAANADLPEVEDLDL